MCGHIFPLLSFGCCWFSFLFRSHFPNPISGRSRRRHQPRSSPPPHRTSLQLMQMIGQDDCIKSRITLREIVSRQAFVLCWEIPSVFLSCKAANCWVIELTEWITQWLRTQKYIYRTFIMLAKSTAADKASQLNFPFDFSFKILYIYISSCFFVSEYMLYAFQRYG